MWPYLRYYPDICLEGLRKNMKNHHDSQSLGQKFEAGTIPLDQDIQYNYTRCMEYVQSYVGQSPPFKNPSSGLMSDRVHHIFIKKFIHDLESGDAG